MTGLEFIMAARAFPGERFTLPSATLEIGRRIINRELAADFNLESFVHRAVWNPAESRIEMHLESLIAQRVQLASLDLEVDFAPGGRIHTENSYKYAPGQAEAMLVAAGFQPESTWTDERGWFAVCLGRAQ